VFFTNTTTIAGFAGEEHVQRLCLRTPTRAKKLIIRGTPTRAKNVSLNFLT
jgi:hypothetical protein